MITKFLTKIFGSKNERELKRMSFVVEKAKELEPILEKLSDEELRAKTDELRDLLKQGKTLDDIMGEAFAAAREASRRTLGLRPFDVQLLGGVVLHEGRIAEMKTGEGKTLMATLSLYLHALAGRGAHLVTVNEYLAERDSQGMGNFKGMGEIYKFLGMSVGNLRHDMSYEDRKAAYEADITYGTVSEFGFDYLRDNMAPTKEHQVQRGHAYAIVDEVDSILIDEARTPLIISGPSEESTDKYAEIDKIIPRFEKDKDYTVDEKHKAASLTEEGVTKAESLLGVENLYDASQIELLHHVSQGLKAHAIFHKDVDYVVNDGKVVLVDEFTGRLMPGRRYSEGLHQALEAKEGVQVEQENQTLATITIQNYFRLYERLSGMTGTAKTEAEEFGTIYKLEVIVVPTNRPMIRLDHGDQVYKSQREKLEAVAEDIKETHSRGQPILVGTVSIEKNEELSKLLETKGIKHELINAKNHGREADIVALAGQKGAVTVATNMAGRGTDIVLGEGVRELGGLKIIGTERHESRRIDNQLRGRSGRQGDKGESQFYVALDDDLMRIFGSERIQKWMERLGLEDGEVISHPWVSKAIARAQEKVEAYNFDIRKHLLEYDDVMNKQRSVIYSERTGVLEGENMAEHLQDMLEDVLDDNLFGMAPEKTHPEDWDREGLESWYRVLTGETAPWTDTKFENHEELRQTVLDSLKKHYRAKEEALEPEAMRRLERFVLLQEVDSQWKEHLYAMDRLREGIGLRGYGQLDPLVEYKKEGFKMFQALVRSLKEGTLKMLYMVQRVSEEEAPARRELRSMSLIHPEFISAPIKEPGPAYPGDTPLGTQRDFQQAQAQAAGGGGTPTIRRSAAKVGRNEPCPCGSGKKYKKCHGA